MSEPDIETAIAKVVAHAPDWLRQELISRDPSTRQRAEETLVTMLAAAVRALDLRRD